LLRPREMRDAMVNKSNWNIEQVIAFHFTRNGLISTIRRFPYVMFLVRAPDDPTAWSPGHYVRDLGVAVKYRSEFFEATRYRDLIRTNDDWRLYFASSYFRHSLPARVYTYHATVLYVDETTGELRHGPLMASPKNAFFVPIGAGGRIVHRAGGLSHEII